MFTNEILNLEKKYTIFSTWQRSNSTFLIETMDPVDTLDVFQVWNNNISYLYI